MLEAGSGLSVRECVDRVLRMLQDEGVLLHSIGCQGTELMVPESRRVEAQREAEQLQKLEITKLDLQWVQVLGEGWAPPMTGFMREREFLQCQHFGCLLDGGATNQSVPIVLPVQTQDKERLEQQPAFTLTYNSKPIAILRCPEFYEHRKEERCCRQFGISHPEHPYIKVISRPHILNCLISYVHDFVPQTDDQCEW